MVIGLSNQSSKTSEFLKRCSCTGKETKTKPGVEKKYLYIEMSLHNRLIIKETKYGEEWILVVMGDTNV